MLHAQVHQIRDIRLANAHDRIRAAPVNLHRSIRLGNRATRKHNVVDLARRLPRIFRLENPGIAYAD